VHFEYKDKGFYIQILNIPEDMDTLIAQIVSKINFLEENTVKKVEAMQQLLVEQVRNPSSGR